MTLLITHVFHMPMQQVVKLEYPVFKEHIETAVEIFSGKITFIKEGEDNPN